MLGNVEKVTITCPMLFKATVSHCQRSFMLRSQVDRRMANDQTCHPRVHHNIFALYQQSKTSEAFYIRS